MKKETIKKLCCPFDKADLGLQIITQEIDGRIVEGLLNCQACGRLYPIIHGIPVLSPDEYRQPELEKPVLEKWEQEHGKIPKQKEQP